MSDWKSTHLVRDDIWENDLVSCRVDGVELVLVNIAGQIQAFHDRCPHAGAPLSHGILDKCVLTCAAHLWQFDLAHGGAGVNPVNSRLRSYPVRIENGTVMIRLL